MSINQSFLPSTYTVLADIKRANLSISNRLRSICADAAFVESVSRAFGRQLIPNERCGAWYVPPEKRAPGVTAYFKSTDGHAGQWAFSLRRLNLAVLGFVRVNDGCVIVDSTRRGKRMPDALSKTIPIWCAVLNRILFPTKEEYHQVFVPPQVVSQSEHAQIEERLDDFLAQLKTLQVALPTISKPLRPLWITPDSTLPDDPPLYTTFHPIILCTASRYAVDEYEFSGYHYVQGAGDDSEGWSNGMTARLFWMHRDVLMEAINQGIEGDNLVDLVKQLVANDKETDAHAPRSIVRTAAGHTQGRPFLVGGTNGIFVSSPDVLAQLLEQECPHRYDGIVVCDSSFDERLAECLKSEFLHLKCSRGKSGSRELRREIPKIRDFANRMTSHSKLLICSSSDEDLAVGIALAILCAFVNSKGDIDAQSEKSIAITKDVIRLKLSWILNSLPGANPSRATLQSVNSFLMS